MYQDYSIPPYEKHGANPQKLITKSEKMRAPKLEKMLLTHITNLL